MSNTLHEPSQGAKYSLYYITAGALAVIWSAIWYYYLRQNAPEAGDTRYYICAGVFFSGIAVLVIGTLVGRIGKEGKNADIPAGQVTAAAVTPGQQVPNATVAPANGAPVAQPVQVPNQVTAPRV